MQIGDQLVYRVAFCGAAGDGWNLGPEPTFFCFVDNRLDLHLEILANRWIGGHGHRSVMDDELIRSLKALLRHLAKTGIGFDDQFTLNDWNRLQLAAHPYPPLNSAIKDALRHIEPVDSGSVTYWPCMALTVSRGWIDCVYLASTREWYPVWGKWPDEDDGKRQLDLDQVLDLRESPSRLPARFAEQLYQAGESGMGYTLFEIEFKDGSCVAYGNGNAIDFISYPEGKTGADIVAVHPHAGRNSPHPNMPPEYYWCLFSGD